MAPWRCGPAGMAALAAVLLVLLPEVAAAQENSDANITNGSATFTTTSFKTSTSSTYTFTTSVISTSTATSATATTNTSTSATVTTTSGTSTFTTSITATSTTATATTDTTTSTVTTTWTTTVTTTTSRWPEARAQGSIQLITVNSYVMAEETNVQYGVQYGLSTLAVVQYSTVTADVSVVSRRLQGGSTKARIDFTISVFRLSAASAEFEAERIAAKLAGASMATLTSNIQAGVQRYGGNTVFQCTEAEYTVGVFLSTGETKVILKPEEPEIYNQTALVEATSGVTQSFGSIAIALGIFVSAVGLL